MVSIERTAISAVATSLVTSSTTKPRGTRAAARKVCGTVANSLGNPRPDSTPIPSKVSQSPNWMPIDMLWIQGSKPACQVRRVVDHAMDRRLPVSAQHIAALFIARRRDQNPCMHFSVANLLRETASSASTASFAHQTHGLERMYAENASG